MLLATLAIHASLLAQYVGQPGPGADALCRRTVVADPFAGAAPKVRAELMSWVEEAQSTAGLALRYRAVPGPAVRVGEQIELRASIVNDTADLIVVSTGPGLRARVADARGVDVWQDTPDEIDGMPVVIPAIGCTRVIVPAQPFELAITWDLEDMNGRPVPPGEYVAHLVLDTTPDLPPPPPLRITVAAANPR